MIYKFFKNILHFLTHIFFRIKVYNKELEPLSGPVILCSNHISLLDPILIGSPLKRQVKFMAKESIFKVPIIGQIVKLIGSFPVNRDNVDISAIKMSIKILKNGEVLGIFPEGSRYATEAKSGFVSLALKTKATVFPVHIICNGNVYFFKKIKVIYGKPITYEELDFKEGTQEDIKRVSSQIFDRILTLNEDSIF